MFFFSFFFTRASLKIFSISACVIWPRTVCFVLRRACRRQSPRADVLCSIVSFCAATAVFGRSRNDATARTGSGCTFRILPFWAGIWRGRLARKAACAQRCPCMSRTPGRRLSILRGFGGASLPGGGSSECLRRSCCSLSREGKWHLFA